MSNEIVIGLVVAVLGFVGGLVTPWVRWEMNKRRLERAEKARLIREWRAAIDIFDFQNENIGDSAWYSSLRAHLKKEIITKVEAPRTVYVGGGRGDLVLKHMLLDEVASLEKGLWRE